MQLIRRRAPDLLAALFGASGVVHLLRPQLLEPLIPAWLPNARRVVYLSGVAEVVCAGGLLRRERWARAASAVLLVAVFPGNIEMARKSIRDAHGRLTWSELAACARLPLQIVLIWAALQATSRPARPETAVAGRQEM